MASMCRFPLRLLFCLLFFTNAKAQEIPHFIEKLTAQEGLSSNRINDIAQDDKGFLWIATTDGLNRFDGTEVTRFYSQDSANSIPHNYVYCLKKLPGNYLAIGTQAGLSFYDANKGRFHQFYSTQSNGMDEYNNMIIQMEMDTKGNLWVASSNCIYVFDAQRNLKRIFSSPFTRADANQQRLRYVEKMLPLSNGQMLLRLYNGWCIGSAEASGIINMHESRTDKQLQFIHDMAAFAGTGVNEYFEYSNVFKVFGKYFLFIKPGSDSLALADEEGRQIASCFFPYNKYPYISWSQKIIAIDSNTVVFLFHNYGLAILPFKWNNSAPVMLAPLAPLFQASEYCGALRDQEGNWWLATTNAGLQKISPYKQLFRSHSLFDQVSKKQAMYEVNSVTRLKNKLWIATYGNGLFEVDPLSGKQRQQRFGNGSNDTWLNFLWNVRQASDDTLWVGTQVGMLWYSISTRRYGRLPAIPGKPSALDSVPVTTQFTDSRGLVWIGLGRGKGLCCYDDRHRRFVYYPANLPKGYPLRYPTNVAEDAKGNLWFISDASAVLVRWTRHSNQFEVMSLPLKIKRQESNFHAIYIENDSLLWLGTVTNGLLKLDISKNSVTVYGHGNGLVNSHVNSIFKDKMERLWLVTDARLSCFDPRTESFSNYSEREGLPAKYPTGSFFYDSSNKRLYSGGPGAVFFFDPESMSLNRPPRQPVITRLLVNGKSFMIEDGRPVEFNAGQNDITVQYTAVDLTDGPQTQYAYRLIGEDADWIPVGRQRQINFSRLAPGRYTFMVRSANTWGQWSKETASIHFRISPPFTQTWWFYGSVLLVTGALFYGLYRFRLRQLSRTEEIRNEISRNLHDEVGSTLTNISLSSLLAQRQLRDEDGAKRLLDRIYQDSQTVSQTMREIVWSINPKIDTMGEALPRMLQYASELLEAKDIEFKAEIAPETEHIKLTMERRRDMYLIFKEAINNLARHSNASQAGIRFEISGGHLYMTIWDNGVGFDKAASPINYGLKNMQERSQKHQWPLTIQSDKNKGTSLELKVAIA